MKFTCSVTINKPRKEVVEIWQNPDNLKHWQDGLQGMNHISGTPGEKGAVSNMRYIMNKREMDLKETILEINLPEKMVGRYEHIHMTNTMENIFTEIDENTTEWKCEINYEIFNGFMIKLMAKLFPSMFRKQTQKWLGQFKVFAEKQT